MKLSRIYSSKLYITSNRKDKIHAAINNPQNAELVQQLSEYLDDDSKAKLDEIVEEKTEEKEEEVAEKEESKLKFDKDIPDEKNVFSPSYSYSKLPELKVTLLEKASNDAKARAESMLKATHNSVGKIQSVRMGVYQITPVDSTDVSDMGVNDSSSIDKKVTAVANVSFKIK